MASRLIFAAVLAYALFLRAWNMGSTPLWVDEAETSINALTILQHGLPTDSYLGLPIYENTYTRPWPESPEYEFRDSSYSARGLAIYHGWLPLYSLAAAFAAGGVDPDVESARPAVRHSTEEMLRRTRVARVPAVLYGTLFLVALFVAARQLYGRDAAWAALAAATINGAAVSFARQARYYSSTLALSAFCCLLLVLMVRKGRFRDFAVGGVLFVLLFHTNMFSFTAISAVAALSIPMLLRHERALKKLILFAGIVAGGVVPWILFTGFLEAVTDLPRARSLLSLAGILRYPAERPLYVATAAAALILVGAVGRWPDRIPERIRRPFAEGRKGLVFLGAWAFLAFALFTATAPAASYFYARLTLVLLVPAFLFGALLFAAVARAIRPAHSAPLASAMFVLFVSVSGALAWRPPVAPQQPDPFYSMVDELRKLQFEPGARLYAESGGSLTLRFYTGLPVQSILPVRKSFLDAYEGEIVILEAPKYHYVRAGEINRVLALEGRPAVGRENARNVERRFSQHLLRKELQNRVARVAPPVEPAPDYFDLVVPYQRLRTAEMVGAEARQSGNPMFDGFAIGDYAELWQVFFYRFVNPESRMRGNLNYAERAKQAEAFVLPGGWVLLRCPRSSPGPAGARER